MRIDSDTYRNTSSISHSKLLENKDIINIDMNTKLYSFVIFVDGNTVGSENDIFGFEAG